MEKFSQFRDRGTQIAPFLPITHPRTPLQTVTGLLLFALRLPVFVTLLATYLVLLQFLPLPALLRKSLLWSILLTSGIWWIDLAVEGVKKGSLSRRSDRLPGAGSVILCTCTSPLDALYLSAIFDPVFTRSYAGTRRVEVQGLLGAILTAFAPPEISPSTAVVAATETTTLDRVVRGNAGRIVAVFPEGTTTNGRGVLRFAPSLDALPGTVEVFPVSLRYTPADVTTPVPGTYGWTLYSLLSRPTHCIRVRIAEAIRNEDADGEGEESSDTVTEDGDGDGDGDDGDRQSRLSERGAEALARIARSTRLNLGVREKVRFVDAWCRNTRRGR